MAKHDIILGVDPGSRLTGYGLISIASGRMELVSAGTIKTGGELLVERLLCIFEALERLIAEYAPTAAAIEQVFVSNNMRSALLLGQARGAALTALAKSGLPVHEYSARQVKKATVGYGAATKAQMQAMVMRHLKLAKCPSADAADALAIAMCHAHCRQWNERVQAVNCSN